MKHLETLKFLFLKKLTIDYQQIINSFLTKSRAPSTTLKTQLTHKQLIGFFISYYFH